MVNGLVARHESGDESEKCGSWVMWVFRDERLGAWVGLRGVLVDSMKLKLNMDATWEPIR